MADPRGRSRAPSPTAHNFLHFMQFCGKLWQNRRLAPPPGGLAPPPAGNPGSAPEMCVVWIYKKARSDDYVKNVTFECFNNPIHLSSFLKALSNYCKQFLTLSGTRRLYPPVHSAILSISIPGVCSFCCFFAKII